MGSRPSQASQRSCHDDVAYGLLTTLQAPDFVTVSLFGRARRGVQEAVHTVAGVVRPSRAGVIGSGWAGWLEDPGLRRVGAGAVSCGRMVRAEGELAADVEAQLADAENLDVGPPNS